FEMHLARMNRDLDEFKPATTIIDPISAFRGPESEVHSVLLRMVDILKTKGITAVMTQLTSEHERVAGGDQGIPSLIDTWVSLGALEAGGERNRGLYVLKSRGMSHSNRDHAPRGAFFCASVEEARGGDPSGWIGVKQLAVQRVWG